MEAGTREPSAAPAAACRPGRWGLIPLALIAVAIGAFALLGGPGSASAAARRSRKSRSSAPCCGRGRSS